MLQNLSLSLSLLKGEVVGQLSKSKIEQQNVNVSQTAPQTAPQTAQQTAQQTPQLTKQILPKNSNSKPVIRVEQNIQNSLVKSIIPTPRTNNKKRVMLCGTYPIGQSNGYSRVVYYISKFIGLKAAETIQLTIYGFQNFKQTAGTRNDIPSNVILHDALATEEPKRGGFGEKEIGTYLKQNPQDIVIIFNATKFKLIK